MFLVLILHLHISHLPWSVQLVLPSSLPNPTLSQKSQKPLNLRCKHLRSILKALHASTLFFYLNDQPNFTIDSLSLPKFLLSNLFRCLVPTVYNNHCLVIFRYFSATGGNGSSESTFLWKTVPCSEEYTNFSIGQARSLSPPSCFETWTMSLSFIISKMGIMIPAS